MSEWKQPIHDWLELNREIGVQLLQQLVQMDSTQRKEAEVQRFVSDYLHKIGLEVRVWELNGGKLKEHPHFCSPREEFQGSPNVVGVWSGSGGGRSIILNGHVDVVPPGDEKQWQDSPYSGKIVDGKMFGRGVTDMKGGVVSLILAIQVLKSLGIHLKGNVFFQSVVEEESGGAGTLSTLMEGYRADAAIIPEPTHMRIFQVQQGSMWFRIRVKGRSAHAGTRYEGISAIEKSMQVINQIRALEEYRNRQLDDPLYAKTPIPIPINIGVIEGGDWPSSVPDQVKIEGRMGVAPGEKMEEAQQEMRNWLEMLGKHDPWFADHPPKVEWFGARWIPSSIEQDHPIMKSLIEQYRKVVKKEPVIEASPWGTDGGLLTQVGKIPTIVFGPGITEVAHQPNEYIELDRIFTVAEIFSLTLIDWCGVDETKMNDESYF